MMLLSVGNSCCPGGIVSVCVGFDDNKDLAGHGCRPENGDVFAWTSDFRVTWTAAASAVRR